MVSTFEQDYQNKLDLYGLKFLYQQVLRKLWTHVDEKCRLVSASSDSTPSGTAVLK